MSISDIKKTLIAAAAHEVNRAYCQSLGDDSQPAWEEAPEWQQQSALAGVDMHLANPDATPEQSHESWLAQKEAEGWAYGEVKDADAKTHPCCIPYDELPPEQKAKDYLFRAVVHILKELPLDAEVNDDSPVRQIYVLGPDVEQKPGYVAVQYIGRRSEYVDRLYGTGLRFEVEQVRLVPGRVARQFLRHADLFQAVEISEAVAEMDAADDTDAQLKQAKDNRDEAAKREELLSELHRHLDQIEDKGALIEFGARYGVKIAKNASAATVDKAKADIRNRIDQFGAV